MVNTFKDKWDIHFLLNYLRSRGLSLTMTKIGIFYLSGTPMSKTLLNHSYG